MYVTNTNQFKGHHPNLQVRLKHALHAQLSISQKGCGWMTKKQKYNTQQPYISTIVVYPDPFINT